MKEGLYSLILILPVLVISLVILPITLIIIMRYKGTHPFRLLATYAFSSIIEKKTDNNATTKWQLKKVDLDEKDDNKVLFHVFRGLFLLSYTLFVGVLVMFFQLLLVDISYSCDQDDNKDCFEYKLLDTNRYSNEPINCTSDVIQNGTVDVVCYKIVFNAGLAIGASYGSFKVSMAVINLAATVMLMIKQPKTIKKIKIILGLLYLSFTAGIIAVQATALRVFFVSDALANTLQIIVTLSIGCVFVFYMPWGDLITLKNAQTEPEATGVENTAMNPV